MAIHIDIIIFRKNIYKGGIPRFHCRAESNVHEERFVFLLLNSRHPRVMPSTSLYWTGVSSYEMTGRGIFVSIAGGSVVTGAVQPHPLCIQVFLFVHLLTP